MTISEERLFIFICIFQDAVESYFTFMDVKAIPHSTVATAELLEREEIHYLDWFVQT